MTDNVNAFATYSRSFEPVSASWVARYGRGKTDYKPIEGDNYVLGIKADLFDNRLAGGITLFQQKRINSTRFDRDDENRAVAAVGLNWMTTRDNLFRTIGTGYWPVAGVDLSLLVSAALAAKVAVILRRKQSVRQFAMADKSATPERLDVASG